MNGLRVGTPTARARRPNPLTPRDEALVDDHFVPIVSPDLPGYASDGPGGRRRGHAHRFTPTKPQPFTFEQRAKLRPKPIMTVGRARREST